MINIRHRIERSRLLGLLGFIIGMPFSQFLCATEPNLTDSKNRITEIKTAAKLESIKIEPEAIELSGARSRQSLLATAIYSDGSTRDVTEFVTVASEPEGLIQYEAETFFPNQDGKGNVTVSFEAQSFKLPFSVSNAKLNPPIEFRNEVLQVLTKSGCNTGKCHGAASGKDGFRLSLYGYDPEGDHFRLTREQFGRRINLASPDNSLLLLKALGEVAHTGGQCMEMESESFEILRQWIREGATSDQVDAPEPTGIEVYPNRSVFANPVGEQKMVVMATFEDGTRRDVTAYSVFMSNNEGAAAVDEHGMVSAKGAGAAFVMARFDKFTQGTSFVVRSGKEYSPNFPKPVNEIDRLVNQRLNFLHIEPSELSSDEQFLRRVYLDLVGLLPTEQEYAAFKQDTSLDKRAKLIDSLIDRDEFKDIWVMRWAELLQIRTSNGISPKALKLYDKWLRDYVHQGASIDEIVQAVIPASGGTIENPVSNYYQTETTPQLIAENVAQVFLGTRIQCAQCHNHPFDRWTMDDYYGFAAFFSQVGYKQANDPRELTVFDKKEGMIEHPVAGRTVVPQFLGDNAPPEVDGKDYRAVVAEWLASKENPAFAKNIANVVWSHFFGIGIVEPVDDFRVSNPPSNPELLDYLGNRLAEEDFDIKNVIREICNSRTYQTATKRTDINRLDEREFSHQKIRRLRAEILLDCICQATNAAERLPGLPPGARAVQVADGTAAHYFLNTFGRSNRSTPCTCEVKTSPTLSQALHLLNGESTTGKIKEGNLIRSLLDQGQSPIEVAKSLYRRCLTRECTESEIKNLQTNLADYKDPAEGLEDLFWAILNSNEFIFNH